MTETPANPIDPIAVIKSTNEWFMKHFAFLDALQGVPVAVLDPIRGVGLVGISLPASPMECVFRFPRTMLQLARDFGDFNTLELHGASCFFVMAPGCEIVADSDQKNKDVIWGLVLCNPAMEAKAQEMVDAGKQAEDEKKEAAAHVCSCCALFK